MTLYKNINFTYNIHIRRRIRIIYIYMSTNTHIKRVWERKSVKNVFLDKNN